MIYNFDVRPEPQIALRTDRQTGRQTHTLTDRPTDGIDDERLYQERLLSTVLIESDALITRILARRCFVESE